MSKTRKYIPETRKNKKQKLYFEDIDSFEIQEEVDNFFLGKNEKNDIWREMYVLQKNNPLL